MQEIGSKGTYSVYDSTYDKSNSGRRQRNPCEDQGPTLLLVFDTAQANKEFKLRLRSLWEILKELAVCENEPLAENYLLQDNQLNKEPSEPIQESADEDGVRLLFEKMLALRMDQHALAIADGYRTRPQVCICNNACCDCFDYSNFLHNLKLHNHKELLRSVLVEAERKLKQPESKPNVTEPICGEQGVSMKSENFDEFTLKAEEDYEDDDPNEVDLDLTIIDRVKKMICSDKTVCPQKKVSKVPDVKTKLSVNVIKTDDPPYETKFNTVHRRVREFNPDLYKNLVHEEIEKYSQMRFSERKSRAEGRIKNLSQRPPWKI